MSTLPDLTLARTWNTGWTEVGEIGLGPSFCLWWPWLAASALCAFLLFSLLLYLLLCFSLSLLFLFLPSSLLITFVLLWTTEASQNSWWIGKKKWLFMWAPTNNFYFLFCVCPLLMLCHYCMWISPAVIIFFFFLYTIQLEELNKLTFYTGNCNFTPKAIYSLCFEKIKHIS